MELEQVSDWTDYRSTKLVGDKDHAIEIHERAVALASGCFLGFGVMLTCFVTAVLVSMEFSQYTVELALVLFSGERIVVCNHGDLEWINSTGKTIGEILAVPIVLAESSSQL